MKLKYYQLCLTVIIQINHRTLTLTQKMLKSKEILY